MQKSVKAVIRGGNLIAFSVKQCGNRHTYGGVIFHHEYSFFGFSRHRIMLGCKHSCTFSKSHWFFRYHLLDFASTASAAQSLRSLCASVRGAPVFSSQGSVAAAPQVGHGTEIVCLRVRSLLFTTLIMQRSTAGKCPILLIFNTL